MKLTIERHSIKLYPEGAAEEAYVEEVLKLLANGHKAQAVRVNAASLSCIAYIEIKPEKP